MTLTAVAFELVPRSDNTQRISDPTGGETPPALPVPTNFTVVENYANSQVLNWSYDLQNHTHFEIEVKWGNNPWSKVGEPAQSDRSFTSEDLPSNTLVSHRIRAVGP